MNSFSYDHQLYHKAWFSCLSACWQACLVCCTSMSDALYDYWFGDRIVCCFLSLTAVRPPMRWCITFSVGDVALDNTMLLRNREHGLQKNNGFPWRKFFDGAETVKTLFSLLYLIGTSYFSAISGMLVRVFLRLISRMNELTLDCFHFLMLATKSALLVSWLSTGWFCCILKRLGRLRSFSWGINIRWCTATDTLSWLHE